MRSHAKNAMQVTMSQIDFIRRANRAQVRVYYAKDHLGSIRELGDSTGTIRARYDYDSYDMRATNS